MQVKNNFINKVLNVAVLWTSDKYHPIVGEAFDSGFLSDLGTVAKFQFHLNCTLTQNKMSLKKKFFTNTQI